MEANSTSFFPLQQDDALAITCPEFSIWDVGIDHISYPADSSKVEAGINFADNEKEKLPEKLQELKGGNANQELQKKILHREIERHRRREMATLYASLRSVLPPQHIKGKRSISDQIHEATKHIRCLQNNIRQLGIKRENIKRSPKNELLDSEKESSSKSLPIVVTVQPCSVGIEVLISGDFMAEGITLPLSRILQLLLEEGLYIVCCNCTEFDGRLHYLIQSEVLDYPGVNLQMLQRKLISMIKTLADIKQ